MSYSYLENPKGRRILNKSGEERPMEEMEACAYYSRKQEQKCEQEGQTQKKARSIIDTHKGNHPRIPGLWYQDDFLSLDEERDITNEINSRPWLNELSRRVQHYGYKYDYKTKQVSELADKFMPVGILEKLDDSFTLSGFDQLIVNEYTPGQGIASHVDAKNAFGPVVVSVSTGSNVIMTFKNKDRVEDVLLRRRSVAILQGDARNVWTHEIKKHKDNIEGVRISLTFRMIKK